MNVRFPYGKTLLSYDFEKANLLTSSIEGYDPKLSEQALVETAMAAPEGGITLRELARDKQKIVLIASDHTRPVPSKVIVPPMLRELRAGNPDADITILISTGCHRETTKDELVSKFGPEIVANEKIVIHDCDDGQNLVNVGTLPSGGQCLLNRLAVEADLLVAEGFIEPHFFAGFSGGRKSVLPGVAGRETVLANHCSEFIAHPCSRTGILEGNPIHADMLWAAKKVNLRYIVNVVLNGEKQVIYAVAGDLEKAHKKGTDFLSGLCGVQTEPADIVISTNGGYPLDQNVYQAVKGMTAAEAAVKEGGVIIMLAASNDGIGGDHFYHQLADERDLSKTMAAFLNRSRKETVPDQWQTQIFIRVLQKARVIYVSEIDPQTVEDMHMIPAADLQDAMEKAKKMIGKENPTITAIPDGVAVMVKGI